MKTKKLLRTVVTSALVLTGGVLVACGGTEEEVPHREPGPESGVYYNYDGGSSRRALSLSDGDQAALEIDGASMSGTYAVDGTSLRFSLSDVGELAGTLENDTVVLTYNSEQLKFWKDIDYTVTYETFGGSAVAQSNVKYGQVLAAPTAPTRGNDAFLGWTTVAHGETLYSFTEHVGGNMTLYAKWVEATDNEYVISYDLGYEGATAIPSAQTAAGRAYNLPTPTRSGYTFKGWWVSQYHSADKLSYRCNEGVTEFGADTTLYAKWQADGETNPDITVTSSGISWERTGSEVKIIVRGPEGYGNNGATEDRFGATGAASKSIDFTQSPAGDYEITLESGGNTYKVFYKNKAVNDVSKLHVVNNNRLEYSAVSGAEKYYVTVDCGTPGHSHVMIDNGTNTAYDFSACDMKPEGITFTVYAAANGKATSAGRTLNHEAHLAAVNSQSYALDAETGVLSWTAVEHATSYAVSVNGGAAQDVTDTNFSINNYDGEVSVSVVPKGHGYNPGAAAVYSYTRTNLSTPQNLRIEGSTLKWTGATGASGYQIRVGNVTLTSTAPEIDLNAANIEWQENQEYNISVRSVGANGANASYWSNQTSAAYNTSTSPTPRYSKSTLTWAYALGVDHYEVRVNDGAVVTVTDNYLNNIVLTKRGMNVIRFRSVTADGPNEWKELQVMAYEISFISDGTHEGSYFKATGDLLALPRLDQVRPGYEFTGWRTASENGAVYDQDTFTGNANLVLYAATVPHTYTVNLDYGAYGTAPDGQATAAVEYDSSTYTLPVPNITNGTMQFIGWNSSSLGDGVAYTNSSGEASSAWKNPNENATVYAVYVDALTFTEDGDNYYMVSAGREISRVKDLVIPATYNGKPVRSLNENAFKNCKSLVSVTIPSTVETIPETAFDGCTIQKYKSYVVASNLNPVFEATDDGVLLRHNYATGALDLMFVPALNGDTFRVPNGVTNLRTRAFNGLRVSEIVIPASVKTIAISAFNNCTNLTKVTFEEGAGEALEIDNAAFNNCANIEELVLPGRLSKWGEDGEIVSALSNFAKLKKITVVGVNNNSKYSSDENGMLFGKTLGIGDTLLFCPRASELTEYVVPSSVLYIGDGAFSAVKVNGSWQSRKLTTVTFHNQMRGIGEKAFYYAARLNSVTFTAAATPGNGIAIGKEAFYGCSGITTLDFQETGALNADNVYVPTTTCSVASIGDSAFGGIRAATIVLPSTLMRLGNNAFSSNNLLSSLDLGHINDSVVFGTNVFSGNTRLTSVEITPNIGVIQFQTVFRGCSITDFDVSNNPRYAVDSGVIYNSDFTQLVYVPESVDLSTYTLKETVTELAGGIFSGRDDVTDFVVPAAVTNIGINAFSGCTNLTSITFVESSNSLTIGANAFQGCASLTEITIPGRTTEIGERAFMGSGIVTATFEEGVTAVPERAFQGVTSLKTVNIASTVTEIGESAFSGSGVTTVTFANANVNPSGTGKIIKDHAFANCAGLVNIVLPEGLQYVSESMFEACSSLKSVTIPTTVKNVSGEAGIGKSAFYNCTELETITFTGSNDENVTGDISFGEFSLYNTEHLTTIDLPKRAAPLTTGGYDVFQMSGKSGYLNQIGVFDYRDEGNTLYLPKCFLQSLTIGGEASGKNDKLAIFDGVLYTANYNELVLCPEYYNKDTVTISKYATTIRPGAFKKCLNIEHVLFEAADDLQDENGNALPDFYFSSVVADDKHSAPDSAERKLQVFYECYNITSIKFPARLTEIGAYAFWKPTGNSGSNTPHPYFSEVTFADGCKLKKIGEGAFTCSNLISIVLPENLEVIGANAFYGSTKLASVTWPNKLHTIEGNPSTTGTVRGAFEETALSGNLELPNSLVNIGKYAFRGLNITSVSISPNIESLGEGAFSKTKLTEVALNLTNLQVDKTSSPFTECSSLTRFIFGGNISSYNVIRKVTENALLIYTTDFQSVGEGISYLPNEDGTTYTLYACSANFECDEIIIPANVSVIGKGVFKDQTKIKAITFIASDVPLVIEDGAFNNTGVTEIDLSGRKLQDNKFGASAFSGNKELTTVILPSTLNAVSAYAFQNCDKLETVSFGGVSSALTSIGTYAFDGCEKLVRTSEKGFEIPDGVTTINRAAFRNCKSLENVIFTPTNKLPKISNYLFYGCENLRFIGTVGSIGTANKTFGLPESVEAIGYAAFQNCKQLGNYIVNYEEDGTEYYSKTRESLIKNGVNNITAVGKYAFYNCQSLVEIYLPSSIQSTYFGRNALNSTSDDLVMTTGANDYVKIDTDVQIFYGCISLEIVTFGESSQITIIGQNAFKGCTHLKNIAIPSSVTSIGVSAFENCGSALPTGETLSVTFSGTQLQYIDKAAFKGSAVGTIVLPSSIKSLGGKTSSAVTNDGQAFMECTRLTSVDLSACSSTLTAIAQNTFSGCTNLSEVTLNANIAGIGSHAFENCTSLEEITFTSSKAFTIYSYAFEGCSNLTEVNINTENNVTIKTNAFSNGATGESLKGCPRLETISFGPVAATKTITAEAGAFNGCANGGNVQYGGALHTISGGSYAVDEEAGTKIFVGYSGGDIETFTIDEGTTAINTSALKNNTKIQNLIIPASVTTIGKEAFYGSSLKSVTFGNGAAAGAEAKTEIGEGVFQNCASLASVDLTGVNSIGKNAFKNAGVTPNGTTKLEITIPSSVKTILDNAFDGSKIVSVTINAAYNPTSNPTAKWFYNCKSLTTVTIGGNITKIGGQAFYGCSALSTVDMTGATSLKMIGYEFSSATSFSNGQAFYQCTSLTSISLPASLTKLASATFQGCSKLSSVNLNKTDASAPRVFEGCASNLTFSKADDNNTVELLADNTAIAVRKTVNNEETVTLVYQSPSSVDGLTVLNVPSGVTHIAPYSFYQNTSINKVVLPNSIVSIGDSAFYGCSNLTTVENMNLVAKFDNASFQSSGLTSISLSTENDVTLDSNVFRDCTSLTTFNGAENEFTLYSHIKFTMSLASGGYQFSGVSGLQKVSIQADNYTVSTGQYMFSNCASLKTIIIGDSVETIATQMFSGCASLEGDIVMKGVKTIGNAAFWNNTKARIFINGSTATSVTTPIYNSLAQYKLIYVVGLAKPTATMYTGWSLGSYGWNNATKVSNVNWGASWPGTTEETPEA